MKKYLFISIFIIQSLVAKGQYSLPDSLLGKYDFIIENKVIKVDILDIYKIKTEVSIKEIVLKEDIYRFPEVLIKYDKFTQLSNIEIVISDLSGKKIKNIKKSELLDHSTSDEQTISSDDRYLYYKSFGFKVPYRISIKYNEEINQSFLLPDFITNYQHPSHFLKGEYIIHCYDKNNEVFIPNYWQFPCTKTDNLHYVEYRWKLSNVDIEKDNSEWEKEMKSHIRPHLRKFQVEGYEGSNENWQAFGKWISKLNEGTQELNLKAKNEILAVIKDVDDSYERVDKLYKYLQQNMRYVSIQLGVGGWKPMSAQDVHDNKYGDCKALSNYMKSVLNIAGIKSFYALVQAGKFVNLIDTSLVYNQFNHAILGVPMPHDTIFLECTASNDNDTGFQGGFTNNRNVLWIDGENSKIVNTTSYGFQNSRLISSFNIDIFNPNQNIIQTQTLHGNGVNYKGYYHFKNQNDLEKKKFFTTKLIPEASNFELIEEKKINSSKYPVLWWRASYLSSALINHSGKRVFINLTGTDIPNNIKEQISNKKNVFIEDGLTIIDTFIINMPKQCKLEKKPKETIFQNSAGEVSLNLTMDHENIKVISSVVIKENYLQPLTIEEFKSWYGSYTKVKNEKITFVCETP